MTALPILNPTRSCGKCTACCTIMGVAALNKERYSPCKHVCNQGCAIYADRPQECQLWQCAWKSGWIDGDERRRPDNLGVMFEFRVLNGNSFLWVYEVRPNALDDPKVQYLLSRLERKEILVRCKYGSMAVHAAPATIEFLARNGCGTSDVPLMPVSPLIDTDGTVIGTVFTERVGEKFKMKVERP